MRGAYLQFGVRGEVSSQPVRVPSVDLAAQLALDLVRCFGGIPAKKSEWRLSKTCTARDWTSSTHYVSVWKEVARG